MSTNIHCEKKTIESSRFQKIKSNYGYTLFLPITAALIVQCVCRVFPQVYDPTMGELKIQYRSETRYIAFAF